MRAIERRYSVLLHDRVVGALHSHDDHTRFVLDAGYVRDSDRAVLGLLFEQDLAAQHRSNMRLPPWFSNLLPEGRLRRLIAHARNVSESRELELLAEVGHDLPGAVRVTETEDVPTDTRTPMREVVSEQSRARHDSVWRFSLAGVALKFSMLAKGERFTAPGVGEGGDWIVKLPDPTYPQVPLNEYSMMELARSAGLEVPETRLVHRSELGSVPEEFWRPGEERAYAIRRFDRTSTGQRVHMEDLAQVRGLYPDDKYAGSFETVGALIYRRRDAPSLIEFAKRLAFNVLIGNGDAHLKNWSLLYRDPRIPTLSPAYDLVATAVYRPANEPEDLGLKFGRSRRFETVSIATFSALEERLGAKNVYLADEVRAVVTRARDAWPQVAEGFREHPALLNGIGRTISERAASLLR